MLQSKPRPILHASLRLARLLVALLIFVLGIPVLLMLPGAILSANPAGTARASLFPIAVALFDPFLWICVRNSLIVAFVSSLASLCIGLTLARIVGPFRFWGRGPLSALAWLPLAALPGFLALGLVEIFSPYHASQILSQKYGFLVLGQTWEQWITWLILIWANVARSAPLIALSTKAALARVDPAWADAGKVLGANRGKAWRQLVWPIVRPEVARMLASVFAFTLLDPSAPLILGLRRTLPFQIVDALTRNDPPSRLAILGLIALGSALLGRAFVRWWGGSRVDVSQRERINLPTKAVWWQATLANLVLLAWLAFSWLPLVGLGQIVVGRFEPDAERAWVVSVTSLIYALIDPDTRVLWINSLQLGLVVTLVSWILIHLQRLLAPRDSRPSYLILGFDRAPALVFGLAGAALPGVLAAIGLMVHSSRLTDFANWLDPVQWPGILLIMATVACRLPTIARAADRAELRARPALHDAALSLGATRREARRLEGGRGAGLGVFILTFTLAATSIAPAIALAPTSRTRTVSVGFVQSVDVRPKAAALAFGAIALNLIGLIAARGTRSGPAGDWFRG